MSKHHARQIMGVLLIILILTGCQQEAKPPLVSNPLDDNLQQVKQPIRDNHLISNEINGQVIEDFDSVADVISMKHKQEVIVAIKATTFQQINEQKIEKKVKKRLENYNPDLKFFVSSDQKIFIEINQLQEEAKNDITNQKLEKRFKKIKKLLTDNA
ncbi:hypothetical protein GCM10011351_02340 [Paraliobacillus quinghaiensis]|uniref:Sporulation protein n=2 Tax=Paraliobacillus quinghaiensis TaxID=470815 RepID=A0A917WPV6_9BACI|nr:hypothetical protein GCM10011351_02340 [Paraliobacillus quinghaiensis]